VRRIASARKRTTAAPVTGGLFKDLKFGAGAAALPGAGAFGQSTIVAFEGEIKGLSTVLVGGGASQLGLGKIANTPTMMRNHFSPVRSLFVTNKVDCQSSAPLPARQLPHLLALLQAPLHLSGSQHSVLPSLLPPSLPRLHPQHQLPLLPSCLDLEAPHHQLRLHQRCPRSVRMLDDRVSMWIEVDLDHPSALNLRIVHAFEFASSLVLW
jgi:hypothetical protein